MNIVLGASGQVGSTVAKELFQLGEPVKAVVRNPQKADKLKNMGMEVVIADSFDAKALAKVLEEGTTVFLLTPEDMTSNNILSDNQRILHNYKESIIKSGIKKIVGLSSVGAQHKEGTGFVELSYDLEHTFEDVPVSYTFVRPAYYFSNWLAFLPVTKEQGILPTFFPVDMKIPMNSPKDVGKFIAGLMASNETLETVYELTGPKLYSSSDVATILGTVLKRDVKTIEIPVDQRFGSLKNAGFSDDAANYMVKLIEAVINGKMAHEKPENELFTLPTPLDDFFKESIIG